MGFMDKAKQLAEQAQQKLDEAQKKFNEGGSTPGSRPVRGTAPSYDQHGRPAADAAAPRRAAGPPAPSPPEPPEPAAEPPRRRGRPPPSSPPAPGSPPSEQPHAERDGAEHHPRPVQAARSSDRRHPHRDGDAVRRGRARRTRTRPSACIAPPGRPRLRRRGVAGTTGEAATLDRRREAAPARARASTRSATRTVIAGTGSNDTAHSVDLTERATELGVDARAGRHALLQQAQPARAHGPLRGGRRRPPTCRWSSTTSPAAA